MSLSLGIDELIGYTSGERVKWEQWFADQPRAALESAVQPKGSRFPTVWPLMDHIFLTEKRHTQRLKRVSPVDEHTGVADLDVAAMFAYGRATREELTQFVHSTPDSALGWTLEFDLGDQLYKFTARKLVYHIFFHEIRHWAQIAAAVRSAGFTPSGKHDFLFTSAME
jgi:uncharacterized damage-inducible protein DinB